MVMTVERLEARAKSRTAQESRKKRLPGVISATIVKLEGLVKEAERREVPIEDDWRWRMDLLHSHFLTNPTLVNNVWDRTVHDARKNNRG